MEEKKIKGFLIDLRNGTADFVDFVDNLDNLYQLCDCDTIDITVRKVGKFEYDIVCDDEGLLKEHPVCTAFDSKKKPMLVGNLLFVNHDDEGNLATLREEQVEDIKKHLGTYMLAEGDFVKLVPCVVDCEYC